MKRAKSQLALLWQAFTGEKAPSSVRDMVNVAGSIRRAARLAGCSPSTISRRLKQEAAAAEAIGSVEAQINMVGGTKQAAEAAGVSERTVRRWRQQEREGRPHGKRQQRHIDQLQRAAKKAQAAESKVPATDEVRAKLRQGVLGDAEARQRAINPRRAARISKSGARVQYKAIVSVISTDQMHDTRERDQDLEVGGEVMKGGMQAWLNGGSADTVLGKLSEGFTDNYLQSHEGAHASGAKWQFDAFSRLTIGQNTPGATKWGD
ncbi:helix-turn-helix domain-containing protein [Streptomyces sp. NPDC051644]|uniref:helix-turn-helix domain-containing protein n=1 Tax=Streptomyces sp. NPDC051644 TaxID=3365666 RepID=UPI0037B3861D